MDWSVVSVRVECLSNKILLRRQRIIIRSTRRLRPISTISPLPWNIISLEIL